MGKKYLYKICTLIESSKISILKFTAIKETDNSIIYKSDDTEKSILLSDLDKLVIKEGLVIHTGVLTIFTTDKDKIQNHIDNIISCKIDKLNSNLDQLKNLIESFRVNTMNAKEKIKINIIGEYDNENHA